MCFGKGAGPVPTPNSSQGAVKCRVHLWSFRRTPISLVCSETHRFQVECHAFCGGGGCVLPTPQHWCLSCLPLPGPLKLFSLVSSVRKMSFAQSVSSQSTLGFSDLCPCVHYLEKKIFFKTFYFAKRFLLISV